MSNPDTFIDEVNDELKRDRLFAAIRKYGWIAVVAVIALVAAASWNEWAKARATARAQAFGDAVLAALEPEDAAARRAALTALAAEPGRDAEQVGILNLLLAAQALEDGEGATALAALRRVVENPLLPASYRHLAALKLVAAATEADMALAERQAMLAPLAAPGAPFRPLALEQLALLRAEAGDREGARADLQALLGEADVSPALRARVRQVIVILGGDATPTDQG